MSAQLPPQEVKRLAEALACRDLGSALETFHWRGECLARAWRRRCALEEAFRARNDSLAYAADVHRWGFGNREIPRRVRQAPRFEDRLTCVLRAYSTDTEAERRNSLMNLLEVHGLGLATVSKWICFIDQTKYAIYDSRVSFALRDLTFEDRRVFPLVGSRHTANGGVNQDSILSRAVVGATAYDNYLAVVRGTAALLNQYGPRLPCSARRIVGEEWTPALVDAALFMLGQQRAPEALPKIHRSINGLRSRFAVETQRR